MVVVFFLVLLLAEVAALGQTGLTTGWAAQDHVATGTDGGDLGVREHRLKTWFYWDGNTG